MATWIVLIGSIALTLGVGAIGGISTARAIPEWYAHLRKPKWNPPNWVFGPVWTALYSLMAIAAWLVWRDVGFGPWLIPYATQLALNLAWSLLFFGCRRPGWALAEIVVMWSSILATQIVFWRIDVRAGVMFVPYLAWVTFAAALNWAIWNLNRSGSAAKSA